MIVDDYILLLSILVDSYFTLDDFDDCPIGFDMDMDPNPIGPKSFFLDQHPSSRPKMESLEGSGHTKMCFGPCGRQGFGLFRLRSWRSYGWLSGGFLMV